MVQYRDINCWHRDIVPTVDLGRSASAGTDQPSACRDPDQLKHSELPTAQLRSQSAYGRSASHSCVRRVVARCALLSNLAAIHRCRAQVGRVWSKVQPARLQMQCLDPCEEHMWAVLHRLHHGLCKAVARDPCHVQLCTWPLAASTHASTVPLFNSKFRNVDYLYLGKYCTFVCATLELT